MKNIAILVYPAFFIIGVIKLLFFTYLFQIKEYRFDRMKSLLKEQGIINSLYSIETKKPRKSTRNILIVGGAFFPVFILSLYLTEIPYYYAVLALILAPVIAFACVGILVFLTEIPAQISRFFTIQKAKSKLRSSKAVFIGITGSYAKSSVKEYLYHILSSKYKVAKTDKNMNTDVGIALSILKNLKKNTEYFIAEAGAYRIGEIAKAINTFKKNYKYGILTALGNQHIDLFGGKENLVKAKLEIIGSLPEDGKAYINADTFDKKKNLKSIHVPHVLFSLRNKADIHAHNIRFNNNYLEAHIIYRDKKIDIKTHLLGEHSIQNLLPCIALAFDLGMSREEIRKAIETIPAIEGKLSLHTGKNDSLIVNDSYNSSVEGFIAALNTLKKIQKKDKLIISRGIIELGKEKEQSYQRIITAVEKTSLRMFTTDPLLKKLSKHEHVTLYKNDDELFAAVTKELNEQTALLVEGRFTEKHINTIITK